VGGQRCKAGDAFEVRVGDQYAYLLYVGRHPDYGDAVFVNPSLYPSEMQAGDALFTNGYVTFYPATAALRQRLIRKVGSVTAKLMPPRWRRAGARYGTLIKTWVIEDDHSEYVTSQLTPAERQLPIASIWNHEFLVGRIREGWSPQRSDVT
jgi:hypothetical protein